MQGLYFFYFYKTYCYIFLMFYIYIFFRFMRRLYVNGESQDFSLFDKTLANPNYISVYMKVNYLFTLCLFKVGRLFVSSPSQNTFVSSLFKVKRRNILCSGEHGKQSIKCIVFYSHEFLCEILHLISTVVCQMSTLYCGGEGPEIVPVCPDVESMC